MTTLRVPLGPQNGMGYTELCASRRSASRRRGASRTTDTERCPEELLHALSAKVPEDQEGVVPKATVLLVVSMSAMTAFIFVNCSRKKDWNLSLRCSTLPSARA